MSVLSFELYQSNKIASDDECIAVNNNSNNSDFTPDLCASIVLMLKLLPLHCLISRNQLIECRNHRGVAENVA